MKFENVWRAKATWPPLSLHEDERSIHHAASAPKSGPWHKGDIVYNTNPRPAHPIGWVCVQSGTPGTWVVMGTPRY